MSRRQVAQKVIDFEYSRINNDAQASHHYFFMDSDKVNERYSKWNLNQVIRQLNIAQSSHDIFWVGYGQRCLLEGFVFCMLNGVRNRYGESPEYNFVKTKFSIYQMAQKYLTQKQQKQLVENLCCAQYTKNIGHYLNKTQILLKMLQKMFKGHIQPLNQPLTPIQEIKVFALNFNFLKLEILNENVCLITNNGQKYYIIYEKQCVFIVAINETKKAASQNFSLNLGFRERRVNSETYEANSPKSNEVNINNNQSINDSKQAINLSNQNSSEKKKIQYSTPKFFPLKFGIGKTNSKAKMQKSQQIQIQNFQQKVKQQVLKPNFVKKGQIKEKSNPDKPKFNKYKPIFPYNFHKKMRQDKMKNLSLRNTIDMHIETLQGLQSIRSKQKRISNYKSNQKSKSRQKHKPSIDQLHNLYTNLKNTDQFKNTNNSQIYPKAHRNEPPMMMNKSYQALTKQYIPTLNGSKQYASTLNSNKSKIVLRPNSNSSPVEIMMSVTQRTIVYQHRVPYLYHSP